MATIYSPIRTDSLVN